MQLVRATEADERGYRPISDYAFVGDCHGAALIATDGSVDWCCLRRFDADPVFSRLLDALKGGFFRISPEAEYETQRAYVAGTHVLETTFLVDGGSARLTDFMPLIDKGPQARPAHRLVRIVEGVQGTIAFEARYRPVAGFEERFPDIAVGEDGLSAAGCPRLAAEVTFYNDGDEVLARFEVREGERFCFIFGEDVPEPGRIGREALEARAATERFWRSWSRHVSYVGPYRDAVLRSSLVLKALTYAPSGALVAAATTSLPEEIGGVRNWDYRYCWLRDSCFALYAMKKLGLVDETAAFFRFVVRISEKTFPRLLPLYGIGGETDLPERAIDHFEGYAGSAPVRSGNEAVDQHQLDVYGQLLDLMYSYRRLGGDLSGEVVRIGTSLADYVAEAWRKPDAGLWEPRIDERRYTHSAMMAWVAVDRASRLFGDQPDWARARQEIVEEVHRLAVHPSKGCLTQALGQEELDAAVLVAPMVNFPLQDGVLERTVDAVIGELGAGPLVYRYKAKDGLPGKEGTFLVCAFWLVDALLALGRYDEARARFERLLGYANEVGLYSEELAEDGRFLGNFPQAFTHLGLLQTALVLDLFEAGGVEAVRGTYADRALRDTERRWRGSLDELP